MMRQAIQTGFLSVWPSSRGRQSGFLDKLVRQFFFQASGDYYWDLSGHLETSRVSLTPLELPDRERRMFDVQHRPQPRRPALRLRGRQGRHPAGRPYDFTNYRVSPQLRPPTAWRLFRPATASAGFYSGRLDEGALGLAVKLNGTPTCPSNADLVRGRLPQGNFNENVYQLKADFFLSPDLGFMNYVQYDDISRQLGWSARLRWQITPGNEIYLVYNRNWERRWDPDQPLLPPRGARRPEDHPLDQAITQVAVFRTSL